MFPPPPDPGDGSKKDEPDGIHLFARGYKRTGNREHDDAEPVEEEYAVLEHTNSCLAIE